MKRILNDIPEDTKSLQEKREALELFRETDVWSVFPGAVVVGVEAGYGRFLTPEEREEPIKEEDG